MDTGYYFLDYKVYLGEEGWYLYKKPSNPALKAVRQHGPYKSKSEADKDLDLHQRLTDSDE